MLSCMGEYGDEFMIVETIGEMKKGGYVEFRLTAETEIDFEFISSLYINGQHLFKKKVESTPHPTTPGSYRPTSAILSVDPESEQALTRESGRQAVCAIRQLAGLFFSELTNNGLISSGTANPKTHE